MQITSVTPTGFKVLQALNQFRFLTTTQILRLGIAKDRGNLNKVLASMVSATRDEQNIPRPKEIGALDFGAIAGVGRLPRMYFLAPKGAELLAELDPDGAPPRPIVNAVRFRNDYFHRVHTVDFHITLARFAAATGHEITLNRQYFTWRPKQGSAPARPSTSIDLKPGFIDPDSIYRLTGPDGVERLFLVEVANGDKVARVANKLTEYAQVLERQVINQAFDFPKGVRVLWIFEHEPTLERVRSRVGEDSWVQNYAPHFFLRPMSEISPETLVEGWRRPHSNEDAVSLF